jgi:hypothetical protein
MTSFESTLSFCYLKAVTVYGSGAGVFCFSFYEISDGFLLWLLLRFNSALKLNSVGYYTGIGSYSYLRGDLEVSLSFLILFEPI